MSSDDDASLINSTCLCARSELDNYVFPFDAHECGWAKEGRAFCYALLLLYLFIGVAVVSDVFMGAIEGITSKTRIIKLDGKRVEVKVWNDTVANLSLMALGSSAPEILLSCVELAAKGFRVGALGPATIVGSASFNLFMISGICVVSVDTPKRVKEMQVFGVTAFISLFAYTWLVLMLVVFSPGRIQIWEGVVTFLCFPALLVISYAADKRILNKKLAETLRASRGLQRRASLGLSAALGGGGLQRQATIKLSSGLARGGMQRKTNRRLHEQKAAVSAAASARTPVEQIGTTTNGTALTAKQANGDAATAAAPASSTTTALDETENYSLVETLLAAVSVNGGVSDPPPSPLDWTSHVIGVFWKVLAALMPPPSAMGGWPCFWSSMAALGVLVAIIEEVATTFCCLVGLSPAVTAITFVALGTSLPDTFASRSAAMNDEYADASVGNITGSNSVNVFLGIGLPWMIGAIYWTARGEDGLEVPETGLAFAVFVFLGGALLALGLLMWRRRTTGAELGGPGKERTGVLLASLWVMHVVVSSLNSEGIIDANVRR